MAVFDLGLTEEKFWSMTPAEFSFIWERWMQAEERSDRRVAAVLCTVSNAFRDTKKKPSPFTLDDFLGGKEPARPLTPKEQVGMARLWAVTSGAAAPKDLPKWAMTQTRKIEQSKLRRRERIAARLTKG